VKFILTKKYSVLKCLNLKLFWFVIFIITKLSRASNTKFLTKLKNNPEKNSCVILDFGIKKVNLSKLDQKIIIDGHFQKKS